MVSEVESGVEIEVGIGVEMGFEILVRTVLSARTSMPFVETVTWPIAFAIRRFRSTNL